MKTFDKTNDAGYLGAFPSTLSCDIPFYTPDLLDTDNNGEDNYLLGFYRWDDLSRKIMLNQQ